MTSSSSAPEPHDETSAARKAVQDAQHALKAAQAALRKAQRDAEAQTPGHEDQASAEQEDLTPERMRQKHAALVQIVSTLHDVAEGYWKVNGTTCLAGGGIKARERADYAYSLDHYTFMDPEDLYREGDPDNDRWSMQGHLRSAFDAGYVGPRQCWEAW